MKNHCLHIYALQISLYEAGHVQLGLLHPDQKSRELASPCKAIPGLAALRSQSASPVTTALGRYPFEPSKSRRQKVQA